MTVRFAKEFPDELRLQIPTSDVVSKKVALKKKGKEHGGLCPFHNEKTPSFTVNDQKGFYHCFGCGAHGDIISFVMNIEGLDFREAVLRLADDYNITVPIIKVQNQPQEDARQKKLERQYLMLEKISQFFQKNLFEYQGQSTLNYLKKRGLDVNNIKKFQLGFAPDSYNALHQTLTKEGFSEQELLSSGAVGKNQNGKLYDKFRNRAIFPILAKNNKVIAFGGRIMGEGQPKYLNSSETLLFKKGSNLYNYSTARKSIYENGYAVIVEGYMDVLALDINDIGNSVAPLGTAITQEQLQELFKITNDVVLFLDGDKAGLKAMSRALDLALPMINSKKMLRFALLPSNLDPDDFIKINGKAACQDLLKNALTLSETLFKFESENIGIKDINEKITPEKKANLEDVLMQKVELITDKNIKKYFTQYYKNLLFEIGRKNSKSKLNISRSNSISAPKIDHETLYAQNIIAILIQNPKLIDYQDDYCNIRQLDFEDETLSNIKESLIEFVDNKNDCNSHDLLEHLKSFSLDQNIINKVMLRNRNPANSEIKLGILALKYHHCQVSKQYQEILSKVDDLETCHSAIKGGKQKELFDHKTQLEKNILELESNLT